MRLIFFILSSFVFSLYSQQAYIDSLRKVLPFKTGKERFDVLGELAYQYCFINTDTALLLANEGLKIAETDGDSLMIAQAWNDLGNTYVCRGEFEKSIQYNANALRIRTNQGDSLLIAHSLNKIGYAFHEMGALDKAIDFFLRSATIYEIKNQVQYLGLLYNNIGSVHLRQGNNEKAREYFNRALSVAESTNNISLVITAKTNFANILFGNGNYDESEKIYSELLGLIEKSGIRQTLPTVTMNLGVCYFQQKKFDAGLKYLLEAVKLYEEKNDKKGLAMSLVNVANCYTGMNNLEKAQKYLERGKLFCDEVKSNLQFHYLYEGYYRLEAARKNYSKALEHYIHANSFKELIHNEESTAKLSEMEISYETEKKEKELALKNSELAQEYLKNKNQQLTIVLLSCGLLLVFGITVFFVRNQKLKREHILQKSRLALQDERLRISRDLHDNIGAELTLISSSLEAKAYRTKEREEKKELENISEYSRNAMAQLRETIWAIRNEYISLDAFTAKLREYTGKICPPMNINSSVTLSGDPEKILSPSMTINLYRLCQEAIHNAVKHSQCSELTISIEVANGQINLTVGDNGKGFSEKDHQNGYGMKNMKSRAEEMGAGFSIETLKEKGTTISVTIAA